MLRFWEVGLLKVFYAFTMYDLGKPGEAMRWMTHALLDSTENQEIFLNQRVIGYVGSNLDIQNPGGSFDLNVANKVEIAENRKTIIEKVDAVLKVFDPTYFHGAWVFEFDRYDLHFKDSNDETRRAAVAAFAIMVGVWETGSAQSFMPQHERKYSSDYNPLEPHFELNGYINAFYSNFNNLQQEFPIMTAYTIDSLGAIDERSKLGLDKEFPEIDSTLFEKFRQEILLPHWKLKKKLPPFDEFLEEIG